MKESRKYDRLERIGQGSFGKVYKVRNKRSKKFYVLKEIDLSVLGPKAKREAINEVDILRPLEHENVLKFVNSFKVGGKLNIITEHCELGDLSKYIKRQPGYIEERSVLKIFLQVCLGLNYLHDNRILHRDIKAMNIFLKRDLLVKIGDFGVAIRLGEEKEFANTIIGTPFYLSPELCKEKPYNEKNDVWALGCLLYELCQKTQPFKANDPNSLKRAIKEGTYRSIRPQYSMGIRNLIRNMLDTQPDERPSIRDMLNTDFLQTYMEEDFLEEYPHHDEVKALVDLYKHQKQYQMRYAPKRYDPVQGKMMNFWDMRKQDEAMDSHWQQSERGVVGTGGSEGLEVMRKMEREFRQKFRKGKSHFKDSPSNLRGGYQSNQSQRNQIAKKPALSPIGDRKARDGSQGKAKREGMYQKLFAKRKQLKEIEEREHQKRSQSKNRVPRDQSHPTSKRSSKKGSKKLISRKKKKNLKKKPQSKKFNQKRVKPKAPWVDILEDVENQIHEEEKREQNEQIKETEQEVDIYHDGAAKARKKPKAKKKSKKRRIKPAPAPEPEPEPEEQNSDEEQDQTSPESIEDRIQKEFAEIREQNFQIEDGPQLNRSSRKKKLKPIPPMIKKKNRTDQRNKSPKMSLQDMKSEAIKQSQGCFAKDKARLLRRGSSSRKFAEARGYADQLSGRKSQSREPVRSLSKNYSRKSSSNIKADRPTSSSKQKNKSRRSPRRPNSKSRSPDRNRLRGSRDLPDSEKKHTRHQGRRNPKQTLDSPKRGSLPPQKKRSLDEHSKSKKRKLKHKTTLQEEYNKQIKKAKSPKPNKKIKTKKKKTKSKSKKSEERLSPNPKFPDEQVKPEHPQQPKTKPPQKIKKSKVKRKKYFSRISNYDTREEGALREIDSNLRDLPSVLTEFTVASDNVGFSEEVVQTLWRPNRVGPPGKRSLSEKKYQPLFQARWSHRDHKRRSSLPFKRVCGVELFEPDAGQGKTLLSKETPKTEANEETNQTNTVPVSITPFIHQIELNDFIRSSSHHHIFKIILHLEKEKKFSKQRETLKKEKIRNLADGKPQIIKYIYGRKIFGRLKSKRTKSASWSMFPKNKLRSSGAEILNFHGQVTSVMEGLLEEEWIAEVEKMVVHREIYKKLEEERKIMEEMEKERVMREEAERKQRKEAERKARLEWELKERERQQETKQLEEIREQQRLREVEEQKTREEQRRKDQDQRLREQEAHRIKQQEELKQQQGQASAQNETDDPNDDIVKVRKKIKKPDRHSESNPNIGKTETQKDTAGFDLQIENIVISEIEAIESVPQPFFIENPRSELSFGDRTPRRDMTPPKKGKAGNVFIDSNHLNQNTSWNEPQNKKPNSSTRKSAEFGDRDVQIQNMVEPDLKAQTTELNFNAVRGGETATQSHEGFEGESRELQAIQPNAQYWESEYAANGQFKDPSYEESLLDRQDQSNFEQEKSMERGESEPHLETSMSSQANPKQREAKVKKKSKKKETEEIKIPKSRVRNKKALEIYYKPKMTSQQKKEKKKKRMEKYTFRLKNSQASSKKKENDSIRDSKANAGYEMEVLWGHGAKEILSEQEIGIPDSHSKEPRHNFSSQHRHGDSQFGSHQRTQPATGIKHEISDLKESIRALKRNRKSTRHTDPNNAQESPQRDIPPTKRQMFSGQQDMHNNKKVQRLQMQRDRMKRNKHSFERRTFSKTDTDLGRHLTPQTDTQLDPKLNTIDFRKKNKGSTNFNEEAPGWMQGIRKFEDQHHPNPKLKKFNQKKKGSKPETPLGIQAKIDTFRNTNNLSWGATNQSHPDKNHQKKKSAFLTGGFSDFVNSFKLVPNPQHKTEHIFRKKTPPVSGVDRPILGFNQSAPREFTRNEKRDSFQDYFNQDLDKGTLRQASPHTNTKFSNKKIIASKYEFILSQKNAKKNRKHKTPPATKIHKFSKRPEKQPIPHPKRKFESHKRKKKSPENKAIHFRRSERSPDIKSPFKRLEQASSERERIKSRRKNSLGRSPTRLGSKSFNKSPTRSQRRALNRDLSPIRQKEADRWRSSITQREAPNRESFKTGKTRLRKEMRELIQKKNRVRDKLKGKVHPEAIEGCVQDMVNKFKNQKKVSARDLRNTHIKFFADFDPEEKRSIPMLYKLIDIELALQARSQACFLL